MGWREIAGIKPEKIQSKPQEQKEQKEQKPQPPFATIATIATASGEVIKSCWACRYFSTDSFPGNCKGKIISSIEGCGQFEPDSSPMDKLISKLWDHAKGMNDFIDGDAAPYEERKALVPAFTALGEFIDESGVPLDQL